MTQETKTKKINLTSTVIADFFRSIFKWLDANILPLVAQIALAVFAADDIREHLTKVNHDTALLFGVAFAAFLAVKSYK